MQKSSGIRRRFHDGFADYRNAGRRRIRIYSDQRHFHYGRSDLLGDRAVLLPIKEIEPFKNGLIEYFETSHPEIISEITEKQVLTDELKENILTVIKEYKSR